MPLNAIEMKPAPGRVVTASLVPLSLWTVLLLVLPYSPTVSLLLKVALWGIPAYLYPKLVGGAEPNDFLLLKSAPRGKWIYLSAVFLILYSILLSGGKVQVHSISIFFLVSAVVISPIVEEIAFRGVLLQALNQRWSFNISNSVTAMAFILYHVPLWLARGHGVSIMACLWLAFFSWWMGYFLLKSKSLWTCIIIHAVQNLVLGIL